MTDLIERLRADEWTSNATLRREAADEIERLRERQRTHAEYTYKIAKQCERQTERIERLFASEQWLLGENAKLQAVVDAVIKVTDRAAHDRSYDGNLIEDIRAALENNDD